MSQRVTPFALLTEIANKYGVTMKSFVETAPPDLIDGAARQMIAVGYSWADTAHWLNVPSTTLKRRLSQPAPPPIIYDKRGKRVLNPACETAQTRA